MSESTKNLLDRGSKVTRSHFISLNHLLETLLGCLPVNDVPDSLEILRLAVLVLKAGQKVSIRNNRTFLHPHKPHPTHTQKEREKEEEGERLLVRMLPSIHTQYRSELADNRILIGIGLDQHLASLRILHQPRPTTTLDTSQRSIKLLLEPIQASKAPINRLGQRSRRRLAATLRLGRQILPEQAVIDVPAAVEVDEREERDLRRNIAGCFGGFELLGSGVQAGYIGVVVLAVVQLHDLPGDGGLERAIVILRWSARVVSSNTMGRAGWKGEMYRVGLEE